MYFSTVLQCTKFRETSSYSRMFHNTHCQSYISVQCCNVQNLQRNKLIQSHVPRHNTASPINWYWSCYTGSLLYLMTIIVSLPATALLNVWAVSWVGYINTISMASNDPYSGNCNPRIKYDSSDRVTIHVCEQTLIQQKPSGLNFCSLQLLLHCRLVMLLSLSRRRHRRHHLRHRHHHHHQLSGTANDFGTAFIYVMGAHGGANGWSTVLQTRIDSQLCHGEFSLA